jgi:hypothetical protein
MRITEISPATNEDGLVNAICRMMDAAAAHITAEASWAVLEQYFYESLLGRQTLSAATVLAWAEAGHPAADRAIRRYAAEMIDHGRKHELLIQIDGYIVKTLVRPFLPFPRGHHVVQHLMRNIWLPMVVAHVAQATNMPATRSASTTAPSAAYFVARALKQKGIKLKERQLNQVYWNRSKIAETLEASMPLIPSTF